MTAAPWTFADYILFHAKSRPGKPAVILADRIATYGMMAQGMQRVGARLRRLYLKRGDLVCIVVANPIRHLIVAAALFRMGCPVMSASRVSDVTALGLPVTVFLHDAGEAMQPGARMTLVDDAWFSDESAAGAAATEAGFESDDALCRIEISSGTTGRPKAVAMSVRGVNQWILSYYRSVGLGVWDRLMCLPGLTGSWGFSLAAHTLQAGRTFVAADSARTALEMLSVYEVDALAASSQQLIEMCRLQKRSPMPCTSLRRIHTGGSFLTRDAIMEARARLCGDIILQYGSSEAGPVAYASAEHVMVEDGACGFVIPGAEVEAVDAQGKALPVGAEGDLRMRVPWQAIPFPPGSNNSDFRDGWFFPGDRGRIGIDGMLVLTGRSSEIINAGGFKIAPELVEEIVLRHPNVAEAAAYGLVGPDGVEAIHLAVVLRAPVDPKHLIDWCGAQNVPVAKIIPVDSIPKTELGKIRREDLKRRLADTAA